MPFLQPCENLLDGVHRPANSAQHEPCASCLKDRLQLYKKKVEKVAYDTELAAAKPTLQLDVATANRFINAAMTDLQPAQREALRQVLPNAMTLLYISFDKAHMGRSSQLLSVLWHECY